jgi:hypothetical protein
MTETTETTETKTIPARWAWLYKACNGGSAWDMDAGYLSKLISELGASEAREKARETELLQIIRELLAMEELDLGDHSQLPEDHPIARAEKAIEVTP